MNKKQILLSAALATAMAANAQVTIHVDASNPSVKVSPNLYGIFFEDINHAADGGLYAELISNRSFEDDDKNIPTWKTAAQEGAKINAQLINKGLLNKAQGKALQLSVAATPNATASLINEGFWGINAVQGRTYKLSFWAKGSYKGNLKTQLINEKGDKVYAETTVSGKIGKKWTNYTAELTANANDAKAQFALVADGKGTILLDVVSLFLLLSRIARMACALTWLSFSITSILSSSASLAVATLKDRSLQRMHSTGRRPSVLSRNVQVIRT